MAEERTQTVCVSLKEGYQFTASFGGLPGGGPIGLDEPAPLGEGQAPNATALLAAAVGNCLAASLLFCLRRSHLSVDKLESKVTARVARNEAGRLRIAGIEVELSPGLSSQEAARLARCQAVFEDFCVVTESVRHGIPVTVAVKVPAVEQG
jgi:uncharacterized OsmC-like protein